MQIFSLQKMIRKGRKYSPEEILPRVGSKNDKNHFQDLDGDQINFYTKRLRLFALKGVICFHCGLAGSFFIKQKHSHNIKNYHLSLFAINAEGNEVEITLDHKIPKSKNGPDRMSNWQPLCYYCNQKKGNNPELS